MQKPSRSFLPATGHAMWLPLYDPLVKLVGGDAARERLLEQAALRPGQRVLDLGCGTGTFAISVKRLHPEIEVLGIDPDPRALARARRKAERAALGIRFDQGFADELPYPEGSFDRVFSSFVWHHLKEADKVDTLRAIRRVLKPGGSLHLLDFESADGEHRGLLSRVMHSGPRLRDNAPSRVLELMRKAALVDPCRVDGRATLLGRVAYYRAGA